MNVSYILSKTKETKGTFLYKEENVGRVTFYLPKEALAGNPPPDKIKLTITGVENVKV